MRIETRMMKHSALVNIYAYGFILTYHVLFTARKPRVSLVSARNRVPVKTGAGLFS
jgi:hypothetical protein